MVKNPPADAGDVSLIPGLGRSLGEGNGNPFQYSCLKKSHGQRSLAGSSPWGHKESDMTEQLTLLLSGRVGTESLRGESTVLNLKSGCVSVSLCQL